MAQVRLQSHEEATRRRVLGGSLLRLGIRRRGQSVCGPTSRRALQPAGNRGAARDREPRLGGTGLRSAGRAGPAGQGHEGTGLRRPGREPRRCRSRRRRVPRATSTSSTRRAVRRRRGSRPRRQTRRVPSTWKWMVGRKTTKGKWPVMIACSLGDRSGDAETTRHGQVGLGHSDDPAQSGDHRHRRGRDRRRSGPRLAMAHVRWRRASDVDRRAPASATPSASGVTIGLPRRDLTPGAINPAATQDNLAETVCKPGWATSVRPPSAYTSALKLAQIIEYGYADKDPRHYQEDHLVPLELGGAPRDQAEPLARAEHDHVARRDVDRQQGEGRPRGLPARPGLRRVDDAPAGAAGIARDWVAAWQGAGRP